jgi:hypothetical protein
MSDRGSFSVDRALFDHPLFAAEPYTEREAWTWLIGEASWGERRKRVGNATIVLQRGQLGTSVRKLAERWQWSKSRVDRFLARLRDENMIATDAGTGALLVTVCNYDAYQRRPERSGTRVGHRAGHERDTRGTRPGQSNPQPELDFSPAEEVERDAVVAESGTRSGTQITNKGTNKQTGANAPAARAHDPPPVKTLVRKVSPRTQFPDGWTLTTDQRAWARSRQPSWTDDDVDREFERFRDRNLATASLYVDWPAAWRTWVTSPYQRPTNGVHRPLPNGGGHLGASRKPTLSDIARADVERLERLERQRREAGTVLGIASG